MTFRERYMAGEADFEEIFKLTDEWNFSGDPRTLREYLGLTADEEDVWISDSDEALEELLEKEKNTYIFFTDLDGTLLNDKKEIGPETRKALDRLLSDGHRIVISTGRALASAKRVAQDLDLMQPGCYIICFNGGQIYDIGQKKILFSRSLPMDLVRFCFDKAREFGINIQTYTREAVITEIERDELYRYAAIQKLPARVVPDVTKELTEEPAKMLATDTEHPERVDTFRRELQPLIGDRADLFISRPEYLEIVPKNVNKGAAVEFLCGCLGIPIANSVAAGDQENDLTMLKAAHIGACMCNGADLVKEQSDYITEKDNNHDGAAEIIRKFILEKR